MNRNDSAVLINCAVTTFYIFKLGVGENVCFRRCITRKLYSKDYVKETRIKPG